MTQDPQINQDPQPPLTGSLNLTEPETHLKPSFHPSSSSIHLPPFPIIIPLPTTMIPERRGDDEQAGMT